MKRLFAGAAAVVCAGAGMFVVGSATGQGTGGTLGAGAVGSKTFEVRIKPSQFGVNCGRPATPAQCFRRGPRISNILAGNGRVFDGGSQVGTALFASIVGRRVGRSNNQDVFLATITFNNRADSLSVLGPGASNGPALPYAIVGGTGIYAGARGSVSEGRSVDTRSESRIPLNFTFIP